MQKKSLIIVMLLGLSIMLVGLAGFEDYYPDRSDPTISEVTPASEAGNIGGETITIANDNQYVDIDGTADPPTAPAARLILSTVR